MTWNVKIAASGGFLYNASNNNNLGMWYYFTAYSGLRHKGADAPNSPKMHKKRDYSTSHTEWNESIKSACLNL